MQLDAEPQGLGDALGPVDERAGGCIRAALPRGGVGASGTPKNTIAKAMQTATASCASPLLEAELQMELEAAV
jgi:hypothetical protein